MDHILGSYASDDSDNDDTAATADAAGKGGNTDASASKRMKVASVAPTTQLPAVVAAPDVAVEDLTVYRYMPGVTTKEITHNVPYVDLAKPLAGPANPFSGGLTTKNTLTGFVEPHSMSDFSFTTLQRTYHNYGYTVHPNADSELHIVGDVAKWYNQGGATINDKVKKSDAKRKRKGMGDPASVDGSYLGPWAGYADEEADASLGAAGPTDEQKAAIQEAADAVEAATAAPAATATKPAVTAATADGGSGDQGAEAPGKEKSVFHGKELHDYLGRTYMHVPTDIDGVNLNGEPGGQECYIPKRLLHTWTGHTKGVNAIQFIPKSAHLLLSCSMDSKVKLWDVYHDRRCLRTFMGHSKAVKAIDFSNDGRRFLTASYDKWIKLWDTETGQCIRSFTTRRVPHCVKFHPGNDRQHIFLTGCADKKVYQFNTTTGGVVQEYDQHLGPVNTITFVDDNRRFVTTSDDKTIRAWEFDIPVVIKYIAEPSMHSMPAVTLHPSHKWLACQSLDNQILIYSTRDRFKLQRNKVFRGHLVAGFACRPGFSPDGRFVSSGDSEGAVWFWDWKTCKVLKKLRCHDQVVMAAEWHPHETSKVATCSWDGTIK
ncbi:pre-mRNA-processing factor 17 [Cladochytrium tenue]|nr:pre-mRNA-processing factor 17 [Cladochytrium tenue]